MDFKRTTIWFVLLAAALLWAGQAMAATTPGAAYVGTEPAHWHDINAAWLDAFHHPNECVEMGLDIRLREVYANNIFSPNSNLGGSQDWNEHNWQEYRTRWSLIWTMAPDVTFNTRLVWDFWTITSPQRHFNDTLAAQDTDLREVMFDRMNIQWKNAFDAPMTLTVGRQDIILGTGWLVLDGSPADDGRTIFFDAIRDTIALRDTTTLDLIYIKQYDDEEKWLPPFNHEDYIHTTQSTDQDGFIAYLTDKSIKDTQLEGYYIYKKEDPSDYAKFWLNKGKNWSPAALAANAETHTFGGRIAQNLDQNWSYSVEAAKQFGRYDGGSSKGLGTNDRLTYAFNDERKNEVHLMYEYLSGDDKSTSGNERFNTLWGDWPQSQRGTDLQSYLWTFEGNLGEVSNLHRLGIGHSFKPCALWSLATDYNLLWADQNGAQQANPAFVNVSDNGYFRGQMISCMAVYSCCKNFSTHFAVDYFIPGDYYDDNNNDNAVYARVNLEWTF